jgi:hypothetical protein
VFLSTGINYLLILSSNLRVGLLSDHVSSFLLLDTCFHAGFLLGLFFDRDNEVDIFLRNIG